MDVCQKLWYCLLATLAWVLSCKNWDHNVFAGRKLNLLYFSISSLLPPWDSLVRQVPELGWWLGWKMWSKHIALYPPPSPSWAPLPSSSWASPSPCWPVLLGSWDASKNINIIMIMIFVINTIINIIMIIIFIIINMLTCVTPGRPLISLLGRTAAVGPEGVSCQILNIPRNTINGPYLNNKYQIPRSVLPECLARTNLGHFWPKNPVCFTLQPCKNQIFWPKTCHVFNTKSLYSI